MRRQGIFLEVGSNASTEKKIHTNLCYPSFIEKNLTVLFSGIVGNGDNYCGGRSNCRSAFKDAQFLKKINCGDNLKNRNFKVVYIL